MVLVGPARKACTTNELASPSHNKETDSRGGIQGAEAMEKILAMEVQHHNQTLRSRVRCWVLRIPNGVAISCCGTESCYLVLSTRFDQGLCYRTYHCRRWYCCRRV